MLIARVLFFSSLVTGLSFTIFKKFEALEKAELSTYVVLIARGSLLFGRFLANIFLS